MRRRLLLLLLVVSPLLLQAAQPIIDSGLHHVGSCPPDTFAAFVHTGYAGVLHYVCHRCPQGTGHAGYVTTVGPSVCLAAP